VAAVGLDDEHPLGGKFQVDGVQGTPALKIKLKNGEDLRFFVPF